MDKREKRLEVMDAIGGKLSDLAVGYAELFAALGGLGAFKAYFKKAEKFKCSEIEDESWAAFVEFVLDLRVDAERLEVDIGDLLKLIKGVKNDKPNT